MSARPSPSPAPSTASTRKHKLVQSYRSHPRMPGAPGLDSQTWESNQAHTSELSTLSEPQRLGAPGLDFETWESTKANPPLPDPPQISGAPGPSLLGTRESTTAIRGTLRLAKNAVILSGAQRSRRICGCPCCCFSPRSSCQAGCPESAVPTNGSCSWAEYLDSRTRESIYPTLPQPRQPHRRGDPVGSGTL